MTTAIRRRSARGLAPFAAIVLVAAALIASPGRAQPAPPPLIVHYIDVGQGAAALLEFACGAVLIDAGGEGAAGADRLISYLNGVFERRTDLNRRLDAVFITHTHVDHNIALRKVASAFSVAGYIHNGVMNGSGRHNARWMMRWVEERGIPHRAVSQVQVAAAGPRGYSDPVVDPLRCATIDPQIKILSGRYDANPGWPASEFRDNGNLQSLVIRVDYGQSSYLFTGDLEDHAIETLVERHHGSASLDVDVYEVGHHGSYNGTTAALLAAMTPEMALISMGRSETQRAHTAWAYGHPRRSLVEMLDAAISSRRFTSRSVQVADAVRSFSPYEMHDAVFATGWDGTVIVQTAGDGVHYVSHER